MAFSNGGFFAHGKREDWTRDRHLRNGFLLAVPVFFMPVVLFRLHVLDGVASVLAMFGFAILSNLVWLGFSAWSRARASEPSSKPK
jgi:amino acid permease